MKSMFNDARLGKAVDTEHCLPLVDDITQSVSRNPGAIVSLAALAFMMAQRANENAALARSAATKEKAARVSSDQLRKESERS